MEIWYINHYATPPKYGLAGRPFNIAEQFSKIGHHVMIICATWHHVRQIAAPLEDQFHLKSFSGVDYYHLPVRPYKGNGLGRMINMINFSREIKKLYRRINHGELLKPDVLIPSCVHPLVFPPAYWLAKRYNAKLIYEIRDIWPLSLVELSGVSSFNPVVLWFKWIEKRAYYHADAVVSLLPNALLHMEPLGLDRRKFHFIPNGINKQEWELPPEPLPTEHHKVFQQLKDQDKLIVIYAGAHGPPNALDQIFDLAKLNPEKNKPYHFVLIGDGVDKEKLMTRSRMEAISFLTFLPKLTKQQVITALSLADACFISLQNAPIFRFGVSPNKLGDYLMAGKPIIYAINAGNNFVKEAGAGISIEPYNTQELEDALQRFLAMSEKERKVLGDNGRRYALKNLDWEVLSRQYAAICESLYGK